MGLNLPKKTYKHEYGEHTTIILKEMCSRVNADYDKVPFGDEEMLYFDRYEWNDEQQKEFKIWLANYLYTNTKARKEIMSISHKNKKRCQNAAEIFNSWHGWRSARTK